MSGKPVHQGAPLGFWHERYGQVQIAAVRSRSPWYLRWCLLPTRPAPFRRSTHDDTGAGDSSREFTRISLKDWAIEALKARLVATDPVDEAIPCFAEQSRPALTLGAFDRAMPSSSTADDAAPRRAVVSASG